MSTVVCRGLQSCLESQLVEPRTLRLKLASPKPLFSQSLEFASEPSSCNFHSDTNTLRETCHFEEVNNKTSFLGDTTTTTNNNSSNPDQGGNWNFFQLLSNISYTSKETVLDKENTYVPPKVKRSSSTLSDKSLEMCTENLGSETGTDIIENSIFSFPSSDSEVGNSPTREQRKPSQVLGAKKANNPRSFPPPLTTISGSNSLQVRPHREDGRLIIKAVKAPTTHTYFQAERSHGRLRLCLLKNANYAPNFDSEEAAEEENGGKDEDVDKEVFENEVENDGEIEEEEEKQEEDEAGEGEDKDSDVYLCEEMDGNSMDVGVKGGIEMYQRPTRCQHGGCGNQEGLFHGSAWQPNFLTQLCNPT